MKKVLSLLAVLCMAVSFFAVPACAESSTPVDFGFDVSTGYSAISGLIAKLGKSTSVSDLFFTSYESKAYFDYDKLRIDLFIHPETRNVNGFSIEAQYSVTDYSTMGYIYGAFISSVSNKDSSVLSDLGITSSFTVDNSSFTHSSHTENGYIYSADISNGMYYTFSLSIFAYSPKTSDPSPSEASHILSSMCDHEGISVSAQYAYDALTDLNGVFGEEGQYVSKVNFAIASLSPDAAAVPSLETSQGGAIEVFRYENDAIARLQKINNYGFFDPSSADVMFRYKNVLLRLSPSLPSADVSAYISAFLATVAQ